MKKAVVLGSLLAAAAICLLLPGVLSPKGAFDCKTLDGPWVKRMAALARHRRLCLLLGSLPEAIPGERKVHNTSVLLGPDGALLASYRKIHLFDIDLPGMEHLKESKAIAHWQ